MDVAAVETFTSILAIAAAALAVCVTAGALLRSRSSTIDGLMTAIDDAALWLAFLVATGAMLGSLYFSEVADYIPCKLCWYQRICMYPLSVILLVAAIRRDRAVRWYVVPLAAIGMAISTYHYAIEWRPSLEAGACGIGPESCTTIWFREFGFVTLPFMALCGFVAILALMLAPLGEARELDDADRRLQEAG
jgi:disulfide bond formation protein DsbB